MLKLTAALLLLAACSAAPPPAEPEATGCLGYSACFFLRADQSETGNCGATPDGAWSLAMGELDGWVEPIGSSPAPVCHIAPAKWALAGVNECLAEDGRAYSQEWALDVSPGVHYGNLWIVRLADGCTETFTVSSSRR